MNARNKYIKRFRPLFLSLLLLVTGGGIAYGQYSIIQNTLQNDVPEKVDTLFLETSEAREVFIPELRANDGFSQFKHYRWYVHWYVEDNSGTKISTVKLQKTNVTVDKDVVQVEGGTAAAGTHTASLIEAKDGSLYYYVPLDETISITSNSATGASTVTYEYNTQHKGYKIICDVSFHTGEVQKDDKAQTITEPTLSKRYVFVIADAAERATKYETYTEEYTFDAPNLKKAINFQMKTTPNNYWWYDDGTLTQGDCFSYKVNNTGSKIDLSPGKQVITLDDIEPSTTVDVYVKNGDKETSKPVASFKVELQETGFMLWQEVVDSPDPKRNPSDHPDLYEEVGAVDFDFDDRQVATTANNICKTPMDTKHTNYAFLYPDLPSTNERLTPLQNQYGLYRTANVDGISENQAYGINKPYLWFFPLRENSAAPPVYDLTYHNTADSEEGQTSGFFYYIDASNEPGRIVSVPIEGRICGGTELLVTAWVNDMTRWNASNEGNLPLTANVNFNFIAKKGGEEKVLHRFTSRDALTNYNNNQNSNVGHWQQICYTFSIDSEIVNEYENTESDEEGFFLEVQNNTAHTDGADYAIDDVRIYRTIPRAEARQANSLCDDEIRQIEIGMDYEKLLTVLALKEGDTGIDDKYNINTDEWKKFVNTHPDFQGDESTMRKVQYYIFKVLDDWQEKTEPGGDLAGLAENLKQQHIVTRNSETNTLALNYSLIDAITSTRIKYYTENNGITIPTEMLTDGQFNEKLVLYDCFEYFKLHYDNDPTKDPTYGGLSFISTVKDNMHDGKSTSDILASYDESSKKVYFQNILIPDSQHDITGGFYIAYIPSEENADATEFNDRCGLITPFELQTAEDIVEVVKDGEHATMAVDEVTGDKTYTFTGKFYQKETEDGELELDDDVLFDWFFGTMEEFEDPGQGVVYEDIERSIRAILDDYHNQHGTGQHDEAGLNLLEERWGKGSIILTQEDNTDVDLTDDPSSRPKLIIHAKSVKLKTGENENNFPLVVYPNPKADLKEEGNGTLYCLNPRLIKAGGDPSIVPGDPELPSYPDTDYDGFAVRLGMGQIKKMLGQGIGNAEGNKIPLQIPIFDMEHADPEKGVFGVTKEKLDDVYVADLVDTKVKVVATNDEKWKEGKNGNDLVVANITDLNLPDGGESRALTWKDDYFQLTFEDKTLGFREGFWYKLKVPFYERVTNKTTVTGQPSTPELLTGSFEVILKIVPEYVTWQGSTDGERNWNNDDYLHWKRSTATDLYDEGNERAEQYCPDGIDHDGTAPADPDHYKNAYTPMRFTNVIIQNGTDDAYSAYPYLYELKTKGTKETEEDEETEPVERKDYTLNMTLPAPLKSNIGEATKNIEYDLAVDEDYMKILFDKDCKNADDIAFFTCVRFYGNTCKDIYFKPQTALLHSEYLTYEKAWVDYQLDVNRWYTLASPLKGIVAGDMYLPKAGDIDKAPNVSYGVQKAPAFIDITYGDYNGTRWDPAVYMRGWDKSGDETVVVSGGGTGVQYAAAGTWSNLYNKVSEPFTPGTGFSIGVEANTDQLKEASNTVLFRLPKADIGYDYFDPDEDTGGNKTDLGNTGGKRINYGLLAVDDMKKNGTLSVETITDETVEKLQLVGNPFMAHLDIEKFLKTNEIPDNPCYILTADGTKCSITKDDFAVTTIDDDSDPTKVAPLQSFLVEKEGGVTFKTEMQTVATDNGPTLRSATASAPKNKLPEIRITAKRGDKQSTTVVAYLSYASDGYTKNEDASLLINKEDVAPLAYTVADKQMLTINLTDRIHNIPVGVYGTDDSPVTLTFSVSNKLSNVTLYDKQEKKSYPVTEGMTLTVPGNTSGRYVLNGSVPTANEVIATNRIVCYSSGGGRIDISSVDPLTRITVYNFSGQLVTGRSNLNTPTTYIDGLTPGQIYIVKTETANQTQTEKVEVR